MISPMIGDAPGFMFPPRNTIAWSRVARYIGEKNGVHDKYPLDKLCNDKIAAAASILQESIACFKKDLPRLDHVDSDYNGSAE